MTSTFPRGFAAISLLCLASAARAGDLPVAVRDDAGLFPTDAIARAEPRIDDIRRVFERNLFVRTVASASSNERKRFWFLRTPQVNRILDEQARRIADETGTEGIYVVICQKPRDVHVVVRPGNDPLFGRHDAEELRRTVARRLHEGGGEDALLALVDRTRATLQDNVARGPATSVLSEFALAGILVGGVVLWLVLSLVRFKVRAGQPAEEDAAEQTRRRSALLGAMFGFPAGLWIYDKLYPCPAGVPASLCEPGPLSPPEGEAAEHAENSPAEDTAVRN